jgi:hypothetical protein
MNILTSGDLLGWFKFDDVFAFSNNIDSAVYSFGIFKKVPEKHELPFTLKEVFYVGQSGGQEKTFDRKDKDTGRGRWQTTFHLRMKSHSYEMIKSKQKTLDADEIICVYIVTPKRFMEENFIKTWLLDTESQLISFYSYMHNIVPQMNLAHKSRESNKKLDSISQKETKRILESSLEKFV